MKPAYFNRKTNRWEGIDTCDNPFIVAMCYKPHWNYELIAERKARYFVKEMGR